MPKRGYPFAESFSSQYKIHVGQRELCYRGVFGSKHRQEIYDKTKNLLFTGARAVMGKIWNVEGEEKCTDSPPAVEAITPECNQGLLRGQTVIGQDGRLKRMTTAQGVPAGPTAGCCVCQKRMGNGRPCSQCDRLACSSCTLQCSSCSSHCCSVCTVVDYSGQYDEILCCGCSS